MAEKGEAEIKMRFNSSCKMEEREKTNIQDPQGRGVGNKNIVIEEKEQCKVKAATGQG